MRIIMALLPLVTGCGLTLIGNGKLVTENRTPDDPFDRVEISQAINVLIVEGGGTNVSVQIDSNLARDLDIYVRRGELRIEAKNELTSLSPSAGSQVTIIMPHLVGANVSGAGAVEITQTTEPTDVELQVSGSGSIAYVGEALAMRTQISGSGGVRLEGKAVTLSSTVSGSGSVEAREFSVTEADFDVSGSGSISATVTGRVSSAKISGSGTIDLYGGASVQPEISGSGSVNSH